MATFDTIFKNCTIIDGTGANRYRGDVAVKDDIIAAIGDLCSDSGIKEIDAGGLILAPGFIDVHAHDDRAVLIDPLLSCKTSQGVTTVINGNCGISIAPLMVSKPLPEPLNLICSDEDHFFESFEDYFAELEANPPAVNSACLVGHSTLRVSVMEDVNRSASPAEIFCMKGLLEAALKSGGIGLSTGLFYAPAKAAPTEEVIELSHMLAEYDSLYVTHMRDEADGVIDSINETARIGREARVSVIISHHKCVGSHNHGRSVETLKLISNLMQNQQIGLDAYPYIASSTILNEQRAKKASRVIITWSEGMPQMSGLDLSMIAEKLGCSEEDAVKVLKPAGAIYYSMAEEDVQRILSFKNTMIGSDGVSSRSQPHPRLWGTFPRVLGHYSRDLGLFELEEGVRKMTSMAAKRFGLMGRGVIEVGAFADLVLFDAKSIKDTATFETPETAAQGIFLVMVNGKTVWLNGASTCARPGRVLRRFKRAPVQ